MFSLTKQEKLVLIILAMIVFVGSAWHFVLNQYPHIKDIVNIIDSDKLYEKLDINTATHEQLVAIPFIGSYTANNVISYRQLNGSFSSIEQIKQVKGIKDTNYQKFKNFLKVSDP